MGYPVSLSSLETIENPILLGGCWHLDWQGSELGRYEVFPHPWTQEKLKDEAFAVIDSTYEIVLDVLAGALNAHHGKNFSSRAWAIMLGPWLYSLSAVAYEKWCLVDQAQSIDNHIQFAGAIEEVRVVSDTAEFKDYFSTVKMAAAISHQVAHARGLEHYSLAPDSHSLGSEKRMVRKSSLSRRSLSRLASLLARSSDAVLFDTYLQPRMEAKLQLRLRQIPSIWDFTLTQPDRTSQTGLEESWRDGGGLLGSAEDLSFSDFLQSYARKSLPTIFLEGFASLGEAVSKRGYPSNPKSIFTSNAYFKNDLFKYYAASRVDSGALYFIGQHGGGYGVVNEAADGKIIRDTADNFLTWGWSERPKDRAVGVLKPPMEVHPKPTGDLLLVQFACPPIVFRREDAPFGAQGWFEYLEDQFSFFRELTPDIQNRVRVRLYPNDHGYAAAELWREAFPQVKFDNFRSLAESLKYSRLVVPSYPQTTILESLSEEFPTVAFFRSKQWPMSQIAMGPIGNLRNNEIVFDSPRDAAIHINNVWDSIDSWWSRPENLETRREFSNQFALRDGNLLDRLSTLLSPDS